MTYKPPAHAGKSFFARLPWFSNSTYDGKVYSKFPGGTRVIAILTSTRRLTHGLEQVHPAVAQRDKEALMNFIVTAANSHHGFMQLAQMVAADRKHPGYRMAKEMLAYVENRAYRRKAMPWADPWKHDTTPEIDPDRPAK